MIKKIKTYLFSFYLVLITVNYYSIFIYINNFSELRLSDITSTILVLSIFGIFIYGFTIVFLRDNNIALFCTVVCLMLFCNYKIIESILQKIFPFLRFWHICGILLCSWLCLCIYIRKKDLSIFNSINKIIGIVFASLILVTVITNLGNIINKIKTLSSPTNNNQIMENKINSNEIKRNVYYLVFDEYSNNNFMEKYYSYDNSDFTNWLEENGFVVSYSSRSESYDTRIVMTNNVNLNYVVSNETVDNATTELRNSGELFQIFDTNGYNVQLIGINDFYGLPTPLDNSNGTPKGGVTNEGFSFSDLIFKNTPFYIFITENNLNQRIKNLNDCISYMSTPTNFKDDGLFTMMHLELPHASFVFDQNGNHVNSAHLSDWQNKKYYLDQFIYTTKKAKEIVESIISNDNDAIILLTSDHSARKMSEIESYDKNQCFVALYDLQNLYDNLEGESVINILRMILNNLFSMDFSMLDQP